jgi:hypothetical protein
VNLRLHGPPAYDQGQLGSCTGNAIAGAIEFERMKQGLSDFEPSRLFIYYNERVMEGTVGSDSGAQIRDGIKSVSKLGAPPESDWPYDIERFTEKPPAKVYGDAAKNRVTSYQRVNRVLNQFIRMPGFGLPFRPGIHRLRLVREHPDRAHRHSEHAAAGRERCRWTRCRCRRIQRRKAGIHHPQFLGTTLGHEGIFHHALPAPDGPKSVG